jgi:outer membrane protein OmpA-like peptidoglycan-associated protein
MGYCASRTTLLLAMQEKLGNTAVQRYVQSATARMVVQRQEDAGASGTPAQTPPPQFPALDLLDPATIRSALAQLNLGIPPLSLAPTSPPGNGPLVPADQGPAEPQPASAGDVMSALLAVPPIDSAIMNLRTQARDQLAADWGRLRTGERIGVVSSLGVIGLGALGGALANPDSRAFLLQHLSGQVLPVPGVDPLRIEFNAQGDNLMFGLHLDVGALLPSSLGFGPSSSSAIDGPPGAEPFAPGQRQAIDDAPSVGAAPPRATANEIQAAARGGQPLESGARERLEQGLGADLSAVRVHADSEGDRLARSVDAVAFTSGSDIFFRQGAYNPSADEGVRLLAHETAHVVQQAAGPVAGTPTGAGLSISDPGDAFERAADATAQRVMARDTAAEAPVMRSVASGQAVVQRWVGKEHETIGNVTGETIDLGGGITLTWGQVVAIAGDEYGSVQELQEAVKTPDGQARLRHRLEHDGVRGPIPSGLPTPNADQSSNARFQELALHNLSHFSAGGTAIETWRSHHEEALSHALFSGLKADPADWQQAQLVEAFGQHFLTDAFSAGHVRTPRTEIDTWYTTDWAPRTVDALVTSLRHRIARDLTSDIGSQVVMPNVVIEMHVNEILMALALWFDDKIHNQLQPLLGQAVGGAISGALHDKDNADGIWVASDAHPAAWMTFGDDKLTDSPETQNQAELAVITAREQLVLAQSIGRAEHDRATTPPPTWVPRAPPPSTVYFPFDSAVLLPADAAAVGTAAEYMNTEKNAIVDLVGHTDPIGADGYNDGLGMLRAEAVAARLMDAGVQAMRISTASRGEHELVSTDPTTYNLNRRTELHWGTRPAPSGAPPEDEPDAGRAQQELERQIGRPPYPAVEKYVPHEVAALNDPQEDYHWGKLSPKMISNVNTWIKDKVGPNTKTITASPKLDDVTIPFPDITGITIVTAHPRPIVERFFADLLADPATFLGGLTGTPP